MTGVRAIARHLPNRYKVLGANLLAACRRQIKTPRITPSFLIIGAQKSGTSSMYQLFNRHPNVMKPLRKEVGYFDRHFHKGTRWYQSHFPTASAQMRLEDQLGSPVVTFEGAASYIFHPLAPGRVRQAFPEMKIVALLRDPVSRAVSHYRHNQPNGLETLPMREAFEREQERLCGEEERLIAEPGYHSFNRHHFSYLARGRYARQLEWWYEAFPKEQVLLLSAEAFFADSEQVFKKVCRFLSLPERSLESYPVVGASKDGSAVDGAIDFATDAFKDENERLFEMIGTRFDWR